MIKKILLAIALLAGVASVQQSFAALTPEEQQKLQGVIDVIRNGLPTNLELTIDKSLINEILPVEKGQFLKNPELQEINALTAVVYSLDPEPDSIMTTLFKIYPDINKDTLVNGFTPLMHAIKNKKPKLALLLLQNGAKTNVQSEDGDLALHLAIEARLEDVVNELLKSKTAADDLMVKGSKEKTPVELAQDIINDEGMASAPAFAVGIISRKPVKESVPAKTEEEIFEKLIQSIYNGEAIAGAIIDTQINASNINKLDDYFIEIRGEDEPINALIASIIKNNGQVANALLEKGANINKADKNGNTPLHFAVLIGNPDIIGLILVNKPNLTVRNNAGQTAAELAETLGKSDIKKMIELAVTPKKTGTGGAGDGGGVKPDIKPVDSKQLQDSLSALANELGGLERSLKAGK